MNNGCREENNSYCYFHPGEVVIGVCPLCLNEKLIILAATQRSRSSAFRSAHKEINIQDDNKKPPIKFHRIFDFGSLLHRLEFRPWKSDFHDQHDYHDDASTSQEDSFISIKFEENGKASWDKKKVSQENSWDHKSSIENYKEQKQEANYKETKIVIEHGKPRGSSLRWRKRIGHVFHLIRWKRSNKGSVCHVSNKVEGVKVRKGWIRTLSKKRTME